MFKTQPIAARPCLLNTNLDLGGSDSKYDVIYAYVLTGRHVAFKYWKGFEREIEKQGFAQILGAKLRAPTGLAESRFGGGVRPNPVDIISKCGLSSKHIAPMKGSGQPEADCVATLPADRWWPLVMRAYGNISSAPRNVQQEVSEKVAFGKDERFNPSPARARIEA